jgi:Zn-dependent protease with chaperone function
MIDFETVRFKQESDLESSLLSEYGLEPVLEHFEKEGGLEQMKGQFLSSSVKISRLLSPRLFGLLEEAVAASGLQERMDLFVTPSAESNAFAVQRSGPDAPGLVAVTSKLVEMMSDDELRFVFGHELAHIAYNHYRMMQVYYAVPPDKEGNPQIPALLRCKLQTLGRLSEISADRIGYILSGRNLNTAVSVFFKPASGLDEHHLRYDIKAFLSQLEEILGLSKKDYLCQMSHPAIPIRVRALQLLDQKLSLDERIR